MANDDKQPLVNRKGKVLGSRIPVAKDTLTRMRDLSLGLGATYDDVINWLLDKNFGEGKDLLIEGRKIRDDFDRDFTQDKKGDK